MIDFELIFVNTISGLLENLPYCILFIWAIRKIVKDMPKWLGLYFKEHREQLAIQNAVLQTSRII